MRRRKPENVINGIELTAHFGLIGRLVKRYMGFCGGAIEAEDLFQAGFFGLRRAAQKFEPERGFAFSTYATTWIRCHIQRCIMNQRRTIRIPVHAQATAHAEGRRIPMDLLSIDKAINAKDADSPAHVDVMTADVDLDREVIEAERESIVENAVFFLPEKDRVLVKQRFWGDRTLKEIGDEQGVSRERIRQRQEKALERLGKLLGGEP
jgi:RNA polymerase sigma factor (sigma-70 family)